LYPAAAADQQRAFCRQELAQFLQVPGQFRVVRRKDPAKRDRARLKVPHRARQLMDRKPRSEIGGSPADLSRAEFFIVSTDRYTHAPLA
jgi:hypothetical protein